MITARPMGSSRSAGFCRSPRPPLRSWGEPEILHLPLNPICLMNAEAGQVWLTRGSPSQAGAVISDRSELPADLGADAEVVFEVAFEDVFVGGREDLIGSIGAEQPGQVDRDLIANTEAKLRVL